MNLIAAVDKNWAIGKGGRLLVSIPEDQKLFQQETMGKIVVMGRKTLESLPGGKPLYGRKNVVLSQNPAFQKKGAEVFHEIDSVLSYLKQFPSEDIFVIGGGGPFTGCFCHTAIPRTLPALIMRMRQTPFFRIWMRSRNGGSRQTAGSTRILTSATSLYVMKNGNRPAHVPL